MEIKQTPRVTRPVEEVRRNSKLPWIILAIVVVILLLAGVLIYFYFIGKPVSDDQTSNETANENIVAPDTESEGGKINPTPDPRELIKLVQAQYNQPDSNNNADIFTGPIDIVGIDTSSNLLSADGIFSFTPKQSDESIEGLVSPNGQFLALLERTASIISLIDLDSNSEAGIKIAEPEDADITDMVWAADSSGLVYGQIKADFSSTTNKLAFYDIESGETKTYERPDEDADNKVLIPLMTTDEELFVHLTSQGSEDPGSLGVIELGFGNQLDADYEQITELSIAERGKLAISSDGQLIAWAQGSGDSLGDAMNGPFKVELLDRSTGQLDTLRESDTEAYSSPLFTRDDSALIYGALSGIWRLDLDSGDRTQIADLASTDESQVATPWSIRPDDELVAFFQAIPNGLGDFKVELKLLDAKTELSDPLDLEKDQDSLDSFFGWSTI